MEPAASAKVEEGVWLASTHPAAGKLIKVINGSTAATRTK
jgi:hypothetical protein